jgi:hypothetical protein
MDFDNMSTAQKAIGSVILVLIAVSVIVTPLAVIWSVNTLFGTGIAYTMWTWLATVVLIFVFSPRVMVIHKR